VEPTKSDELLFMGRLNDDKGVAIAIDVARRVGRRIAIVGQGDPARFLKENPHVRYLPPVDVEGRRQLMAEAAALICPTQYVEPLGNVALEAQASGTPVICTDWGGFTETVLHGVTGYRCRTMEQFEWAARNIDRIDPAACRQWALDNFSTERIGPMFEEYYLMLLDLDGDGWYARRPDRQQLDWLRKSYPPDSRSA
jgi:glycosyltransferase involved in cell wall biosynthesis